MQRPGLFTVVKIDYPSGYTEWELRAGNRHYAEWLSGDCYDYHVYSGLVHPWLKWLRPARRFETREQAEGRARAIWQAWIDSLPPMMHTEYTFDPEAE